MYLMHSVTHVTHIVLLFENTYFVYDYLCNYICALWRNSTEKKTLLLCSQCRSAIPLITN